jgi:hypothetical protein
VVVSLEFADLEALAGAEAKMAAGGESSAGLTGLAKMRKVVSESVCCLATTSAEAARDDRGREDSRPRLTEVKPTLSAPCLRFGGGRGGAGNRGVEAPAVSPGEARVRIAGEPLAVRSR